MYYSSFKILNNKFLFYFDRLKLNLKKNNYKLSNKIFKDKIDWQNCYENLIKKGYAKLPINFNFEDKYENLTNLFQSNFRFNDFFLATNISECNKYGISTACLSMKSPILKKIFNKELFMLIKNFYGGNFFLRNCPFLRLDIKNKREIIHNQSLFHLDHAVRQLTIVIFLNSINEKSTHTKYIEKSNLNSWINLREKDFDRNSNKFKKIVNENLKNLKKIPLIGVRGEAYIFDAGNGLHNGYPGDDRGMIHLTFNQSRRHALYDKNYEINYRQNAKNNFEKYYFGPIDLDDNLLNQYNLNYWTKENFKYLLNS